jgi:hypothetical protein
MRDRDAQALGQKLNLGHIALLVVISICFAVQVHATKKLFASAR